MDVEIGQLLDNKYRIVRLLGEGGMGAVYEGENVRIRHRVAIKVLHPAVAADNGARERFEREAQAAGCIGSEHIVEVFDLGDLPSGARYMVMEFLAGESLAGRLTAMGPMAPAVMAPIMLQLLEGLGAAHAAGIVHRDLKPDNVFLQRTKSGVDFVKIVDFGVSKFNALSGGPGMSMTRTGAVVGTPYYMSPEQVKGAKNTDHRSDIYSAGVVLFECVTGKLPFEAESFNELMFKIALEPPLDPEAAVPGLDPAFASIMRKATARDAADRFATAADFAQTIASWMQGANVASLPRPGATGAGFSAPSLAAGMPSPSLAQSGAPARGTPQGGSIAVRPPMASVPDGGPVEPLAKTTGAVSSAVGPAPSARRYRGGVVAAITVGGIAVAAAVGFAVIRPSDHKAAAAAAAQAPGPPKAPAEPVALPPLAAPSPVEKLAATASASASAAPVAPPAASIALPAAVAAVLPVATHVQDGKRAAAPARHTGPAPAASSDETTVKGRSVRTEL
ncbi:MAG: serine/threonine-protein kinase [Polyangiaceae bacterium]